MLHCGSPQTLDRRNRDVSRRRRTIILRQMLRLKVAKMKLINQLLRGPADHPKSYQCDGPVDGMVSASAIVRNRLLASMAPELFDRLRPHLHSITLKRKAILQEHNR